MPGSTPATSQLDWLISITAMIVLFWSRATRDLFKSFGWGIAALHRFHAATKLPFPRRPPHSFSRSPATVTAGKPVQLLVGENYNHFELPEAFGNPYGLLGRAALNLMGLEDNIARMHRPGSSRGTD